MAMFSAQLAFRSVKFDDVAWRAARHILHVDASHGSTSVVAHGTQALFTELSRTCPDLRVEHVRLWDDAMRPRMEYNLEHVRAKMAVLSGSASEEEIKAQARLFAGIEELAEQVASARGLVISAPMWNFGAPFVLKQYFDAVLHPGLTFVEKPGARPEGLLGGGRPLVIVTSSGGPGSVDHLTPWLRDVGAMLGFDDAAVVAAPNVAHGERQAALDNIAHLATNTARIFSKAPGDERAEGEDAMNEDEEELWTHELLLKWLREQGGLSEDCVESIQAARIDGEMFATASEDDWQNEELGFEEEDVSRIMVLQQRFRLMLGHGRAFGGDQA